MSHDHGGGSCEIEYVEDYSQSLSIGSIFIILAASCLGTVLPIMFQRYPKFLIYPFAIVLGKHIGTGVLMSLAFIHLLVPAFAQLQSECLPETWHEYPFAPLFAMIAALAMHLIETAVLEYTVYSQPGYDQPISLPISSPTNPTIAQPIDTRSIDQPSLTLKKERTDSPTADLEDIDLDTSCNQSIHPPPKSPRSPKSRSQKFDHQSTNQPSQQAVNTTKVVTYNSTDDHVVSVDKLEVVKHHHQSLDHQHHQSIDHGHAHGVLFGSNVERTVGAYLLEFGLTCHSIIVGLTLGVASRSQQTSLIPALAFHQFFEGFALGARLASIGFGGWNEMILTCIYSFSAPLGIAIGVGIVHTYHPGSVTALLVQGIFDSVSSGIILYVAFVQMLGGEFTTDYKQCGRQGWKKIALFMALYVGVAAMAIIGIWL